jgi:hypothetical protein
MKYKINIKNFFLGKIYSNMPKSASVKSLEQVKNVLKRKMGVTRKEL